MEEDGYKTEGGQCSPYITMGCFVWEEREKTDDQWCVVLAFLTRGWLKNRHCCIYTSMPKIIYLPQNLFELRNC
jgi:hypothetical protein